MKLNKSNKINLKITRENNLPIISAIIRFKKQLHRLDRKTPDSFLVSLLGEHYAYRKLSKKYPDTQRKGGHARCDLFLKERGIKLEVKTSNLKHEGTFIPKNKTPLKYWGWSIQKRGKKIHSDYYICIGLDKHFRNPQFFILTKKEVSQIGSSRKMPRFGSSSQRKLIIFPNLKAYRSALRTSNGCYITSKEREINLHKKVYLNRWDKIC